MMRHVAIVGGGAAGIYAALGAREAGACATILERNRRLGIKILISGGGKCNITHDAEPGVLEHGFVLREGRFLRYAFHELPPSRVLRELHAEGLQTVTRPNGRVFPLSGRADDVLSAFERMLAQAGAEVETGLPVQEIVLHGDRVRGVRVNDVVREYDAVVIATGGMSYRKVGTTGDGIRFADAMGLAVVPVSAALAPIYFPAPPPAGWQGVALRDVVFWIERSDGTRPRFERSSAYPSEWRGDLLLTHRGVSGPVALEVSRAAAVLEDGRESVQLLVDLIPDTGAEELRKEWDGRIAASGRSEVQTFVGEYAPNALVPSLLESCGVRPGTKMTTATRDERAAVLGVLKRWRVGTVGEVPVDRGEVTAGGVALDAVKPTTMAARGVHGLYIAGEALDVAGCVGGYNLQAAFSTGYVAGRSAALGQE
ncbi:MAG TPA: aminoacetone oxidase family FAD-binding enzyme [Candidatus Kapabacteria bacterium]|nr:aminoacetone oxidase family FAD-binding enzyme [Candidatus Kapabacteria bacterium]